MIGELEKFVGNRVLGWFLAHPTSGAGINQLARELGVSAGSIKKYVDIFIRDGILSKTRIGTLHLISLNNDDSIVQEMKRVYMAVVLREAGISSIAHNAVSLVVYGSVASGTFDEKSDIDVLVLAKEPDVDYNRVAEIEEKVGHELQVTVIPYYRWEEMKKQNNAFASGILARYIRFQGAEP